LRLFGHCVASEARHSGCLTSRCTRRLRRPSRLRRRVNAGVSLQSTMRYAAILAAVIAIHSAGAGPDSGRAKAPPEILEGVAALAALLTDGHAVYTPGFAAVLPYQATEYSSGYIVLFGLEGWNGGNGHTAFLAYFAKTNSDELPRPGKAFQFVEVTAVGARMWRDLSLERIDGRMIVLRGMKWQRDDPGCCPSQKIVVRYTFDKGHLTEVSENNAG